MFNKLWVFCSHIPCSLHLFLYILSVASRTVLDAVLFLHVKGLPNQLSDGQSEEKKETFKQDLLTSLTLPQSWFEAKNILHFHSNLKHLRALRRPQLQHFVK